MENQTEHRNTTVKTATAKEQVDEITNSLDHLITEIEVDGEVSDEAYQRAVFALKGCKNLLEQLDT